MKYEIRSIGLWSFVKISFFLNLALGFLVGLLFAMMLGFVMTVSSQFPMLQQTETGLEGMSVGAMLFLFPIMIAFTMAVFHTIIGAVGVILYNFAARLLGGLEMALEETVVPSPALSTPSPVYASAVGVPPPPPMYGAPPSNLAAPPGPTPKPEPPASQFE